MPVQVQCASVVIRNDALDRCIEGGSEGFSEIVPYSIWYSDGVLTQASFMSWVDAEEFAKSLELRGLSRAADAPEFTMVHEKDQSVEPLCDWLILFEFEKRLIATMRGNESRKVVAPAMDHDPDSIQHFSAEELKRDFEFVERKDNIDTYRNKETGQLVYSARHTETDQEIYNRVSPVVWENRRLPGDSPIGGDAREKVTAVISELQTLVARNPEASNVALTLGMAWFSVGNDQRARASMERAHELEPDSYGILKELGSAVLAQNDFESAVKFGLKAVAIEPDNVELLGNLAVSQLLSGDPAKAMQTIDHAMGIDPNDSVNTNVKRIIDDVLNNGRPVPTSLPDMMKPWKRPSAFRRLIQKFKK